MLIEDIKSLSKKARSDGERLFGVCEFLYNIALIFIVLILIVGITSGLYMLSKGNDWLGIAILTLTFFLCFINYIIAVLTTHVGKVLVHTSFASLGVLEHLAKIRLNPDSINKSSTTIGSKIIEPVTDPNELKHESTSNNVSTFAANPPSPPILDKPNTPAPIPTTTNETPNSKASFILIFIVAILLVIMIVANIPTFFSKNNKSLPVNITFGEMNSVEARKTGFIDDENLTSKDDKEAYKSFRYSFVYNLGSLNAYRKNYTDIPSITKSKIIDILSKHSGTIYLNVETYSKAIEETTSDINGLNVQRDGVILPQGKKSHNNAMKTIEWLINQHERQAAIMYNLRDEVKNNPLKASQTLAALTSAD